jgi:ribosomal protein S18 acetylase RimI-like enzyme
VIDLLMKIMNINELDTEVRYWNNDAIRFYEKNGFKKRYMGMRYTKS